MSATAEDREMQRLEKARVRQKRHYQRHIGEAKKLRHRPVYFPPEDDRRLDDMMRKYGGGETMTAFMLRIFREWADWMDAAERRAVEALEKPTEAPPEPTPAPAKAKERRKPAKRAAEPAPKKPRGTYSRRWLDRAEADAANRVPVRLEFTRQHHHIPHGMRSILMNSGLQHRNNIWRGRLTPEHATTMAEQIAEFGGSLEITGGLGEAPKWAPGEYRQMPKNDQ